MSRNTNRGNAVLWGVQILLALLFLFAGGMKLVMPAATLAQLSGFPAAFMKFIAVAECCGGLGLVLPGLLGIKRALTPLAAVGLVAIMAGATVVTLETGQVAGAALPLVVGALAALIAARRWSWIAPHASSVRRPAAAPSTVTAA